MALAVRAAVCRGLRKVCGRALAKIRGLAGQEGGVFGCDAWAGEGGWRAGSALRGRPYGGRRGQARQRGNGDARAGQDSLSAHAARRRPLHAGASRAGEARAARGERAPCARRWERARGGARGRRWGRGGDHLARLGDHPRRRRLPIFAESAEPWRRRGRRAPPPSAASGSSGSRSARACARCWRGLGCRARSRGPDARWSTK